MAIKAIEVAIARLWAEENAGDDDPMDMFEFKLMELLRAEAERSGRFHTRNFDDADNRMAEIGERFKVDGPTEDF
jgi:hypothetical protein